MKASLKMPFSRNYGVGAVLKSSCTSLYTPVFRAAPPCTCNKITIFRGAL